jgi:hypothetical protein
MLSDEAMLERMARGWRAGQPETVCGNGSTLQNTANIRRWLPWRVIRYGIHTLNDAGAGDMHWIRQIDWGDWAVEYRPFDLVPRLPEVKRLDITTETMPKADAILCRMVLNHLVDVKGEERDETRIEMALERFRESATYLFATHFEGPRPQRAPQFARLDLTKWLGEPLDAVQDGHETECRLAVWRL